LKRAEERAVKKAQLDAVKASKVAVPGATKTLSAFQKAKMHGDRFWSRIEDLR
jgi:hypothetical protein